MKSFLKIIGVAGVSFMPSAVMAMENCKSPPVFYCEIERTGKVVRVCEAGNKMHYTSRH